MSDTNTEFLPFQPVKNIDDTFAVECRIVVYREKLGRHPDFLYPVGDAETGFYTKYFLLIEVDIPDMKTAENLAKRYNDKYANIIDNCENTGDWSNFPFKDKEIVYYK